MSLKHTPGPWYPEYDYDGPEDGETYMFPIAVHPVLEAAEFNFGEDESIANAKLIAASPDLLASCKWLTNLGCGIGKAGGSPEPGEFEAAIAEAKFAIDKAEGV